MIIVCFKGGLGNQMFQYAAGLRLAKHHNTVLKLDLAFLLDRTQRGFTSRDFDLAIFDPSESEAAADEVQQFRLASKGRLKKFVSKLMRRHYHLEKHLAFDPNVLDLPDDTYLEGFFQDERYFADIAQTIRERFRLAPDEAKLSVETQHIADEIRSRHGICLHVRRGDYVTNPTASKIHGCCSLDYYNNALKELRLREADGPVFVFSDDTAWCRENFKESAEFIVVGNEHAGPRSSTHFWLMSLCHNFVISNSSFSWWAAWLGQRSGSIICCPTPWFEDAEFTNPEICPGSWTKIPKYK
jgi:hypothetical protein